MLARGPGIEPGSAGPTPTVVPLDHPRSMRGADRGAAGATHPYRYTDSNRAYAGMSRAPPPDVPARGSRSVGVGARCRLVLRPRS